PVSVAAAPAPDAPPPPPPAAPVDAAAPAPGAPAANVPEASTSSAATDPLFYFRRGEEGQVLNDLQALQQAVDAYSQRAGISEDPDVPAWPNLQDLGQLVKVGLLKALPAPPAGQKYILDEKGIKVSLASK
ncbi:MAG: hypothetical protein AB1705_14990, partial [Verrucomicrobiota bacterium]